VYRKGIYGHCQMLRVNLRKAFSAGIVSEIKEETQLILHRKLIEELIEVLRQKRKNDELEESTLDFAYLKNLSNILSMTCLGPVPYSLATSSLSGQYE